VSAERERTLLDEQLDRAFAALDQVGTGELRDAGVALERRGGVWAEFGSVLAQVASVREQGGQLRGARYMLGRAIEDLDDESAGRLEGATAPFWALVLEARQEAGEGGAWEPIYVTPLLAPEPIQDLSGNAAN
jgi:hypothetical protein